MDKSEYLFFDARLFISFCFLFFSIDLPVRAIGVTFDSDSSLNVGQVFEATPSATINTTATPNGFGNFFDSNFLLLGEEPNDFATSGSLSEDITLVSTAVSNSFELTTENSGQDIVIEFDWAFQGNAEGLLDLVSIDSFEVALVSVNALGEITSTVDLDVFATNEYGSGTEQISIENSGLIGDYAIVANVLEKTGDFDGSAAGINNVTVNPVPFEFSPTLGLIFSGLGIGLYRWRTKS